MCGHYRDNGHYRAFYVSPQGLTMARRENEPFDAQLKKNKLVALMTIFVTIAMPIAGFFSIPMPATKTDIEALQKTDIEIRQDVKRRTNDLAIREIRTEIEILNIDEEKYTERKYENIRQQDEFRLMNKPVPASYTMEQSDIESKLNRVEQQLDMKKEELHQISANPDL